VTRAKHPLRLKATKWDTYESIYAAGDGTFGSVNTPAPSVGYPRHMVTTWPAATYQGKPVRGTTYNEIPLLWLPHHAARSMDMSLADYVAAGYAPVMPGPNQPMRRPKAVVYQTYGYGDPAVTEVDVVAQAVVGLESDLAARGVFVGRINTSFYRALDGGSGQGVGCSCPNNSTSAVAVTAPITEIGDLVEISALNGNDTIHQARLLDGSPYEAGEVLYVSPIELRALEWPYYEVESGAMIGDPANFALWPDLYANEVALLNQMAALHDRCGFYTAATGVDSHPFGAPTQQWTYTIGTVLPMLAADVPSFDFGTYTASSEAALLGAEPVAPLVALIRAKIIDFFNL
jgi:hypothetical protein